MKKLADFKKQLEEGFGKTLEEAGKVEVKPTHITKESYVKNSKFYFHVRCFNCGETYEVESPTRNSYCASIRCKNCGNGSTSLKHDFILTEEGDDFVLTMFSVRFNYENSDGELDFGWSDKDPKRIDALVYTLGFDSDLGPVVYDHYERKFLKSGSQALYYAISRMESRAGQRGVELLKKASDFQKEKERKAEEKRKASKKNQEIAEMGGLKVRSEKTFNFLKNAPVVSWVSESGKDGEKFSSYCFKCGRTFEGNGQCPVCGRSSDEFPHRNMSEKFLTIEGAEEKILARVFDVSFGVKNGIPSIEKAEIKRFFFDLKREDKFVVFNGAWGHINNRCREYIYSCEAAQDEADIAAEIAKTSFAKSGLAEALGLVEGYAGFIKMENVLDYVRAFIADPRIELVSKGNIPEIAKSFVGCGHFSKETLKEGSTLSEILGLGENAIKYARKRNVNIRVARDFDALIKVDPSLTWEDFDAIRNEVLIPGVVAEVLEQMSAHGIKSSTKVVLSYLQNVRDHQCIEKREAISIWRDYLRMAFKLKYDMSDKNRRFPTSLKKEHDVAVFAFNSVKQQISEDLFAEQANKNRKRYEFSYKDLFATVPITVQDVFNEATAQHNCLRSYVERIRDGETVVCFIRRKDTPNFSYVTVEVKNNRIYQLRGAYNRDPRNAELNEFIDHWKKAVGIA